MRYRNVTTAFALLTALNAAPAAAQDIDVVQHDAVSGWQSAGISYNPDGGVFFGQITSYNGTEPADANIKQGTPTRDVRLQVRRSDWATPTAESVNIVNFFGDPDDLGIPGETGSIGVSATTQDDRFEITFGDTYENPVLFLQVVAAARPVTVQPVFVEGTGALISVTETSDQDGKRGATVNWAVFEAGDYTLPDGRAAIIGAIDSGTQSYDMADGTELATHLGTEGYREYFKADAAILAQAQRGPGNAWQTVRLQKSTSTQTVVTIDWSIGEVVGVEDVDVLDSITIRHSREHTVEDADSPEATVGPIGYMVIGELSGHSSLVAGSEDFVRYDVADSATSISISLPAAVDRALGGDGESTDTISFNSTRDALSVVRVSLVALMNAENGAYVSETADTYAADATFDGASRFLRFEFSDGTSALINVAQTNPLEANDGVLTDGTTDVERAHRFGITSRDDGTVSIHSLYGHYLSVGADGSLNAAATTVGTSETFYLIDLSQIAMSAYPDMRLVEQDMDGDDDPEMVLVAEQEDGTGYLMLDPLGIADLMYKAGYEPDDAFIDALSATQQAGLLQQLDGITGIDSIDDIDGATLKSILDSMDGDAQDRDYSAYSFEYVLEGAGYELSGETDDGIFGGTIALGEYTVMVEGELFDSLNLDLGLTLITVSGSIGALTVSASAVGANATMKVNDNGFLIGAGVELIGVTVMIGDEDGSYASVSAGVGLGAALGASWGQNDQYGVTVDLPIVPVAVAVYVKGEDVEDLALAIADLSIQGYNAVAPHASAVWDAATNELSNAGESALASVTDEYSDTKATVNKFGNRGITMAESAGEIVINEINDFINDAGSVLSDLGNGLEDGFNDLIGGLGDFFSFSWL